MIHCLSADDDICCVTKLFDVRKDSCRPCGHVHPHEVLTDSAGITQ